jgi:uncharacterized membrane protein YcaP (DUF421 family)
MIKGSERTLVVDGEINRDDTCRGHIGENDLLGALHANGQVTGVREVRLARFERNGDISVIRREQESRGVEVSVREGMRIMRIGL